MLYLVLVSAALGQSPSNSAIGSLEPSSLSREIASRAIREAWEADRKHAHQKRQWLANRTQSDESSRTITLSPVWADDRQGRPPQTRRWHVAADPKTVISDWTSDATPRKPLTVTTTHDRLTIGWMGMDGRHTWLTDIPVPDGQNELKVPVTDDAKGLIKFVAKSTGDPVSNARVVSYGYLKIVPWVTEKHRQKVDVSIDSSHLACDGNGVVTLPHVMRGAEYTIRFGAPGVTQQEVDVTFTDDQPIVVAVDDTNSQKLVVVDERGTRFNDAKVWHCAIADETTPFIQHDELAAFSRTNQSATIYLGEERQPEDTVIYAEIAGRRGVLAKLSDVGPDGLVIPDVAPLTLNFQVDNTDFELPDRMPIFHMGAPDKLASLWLGGFRGLLRSCEIERTLDGYKIQVPHACGSKTYLFLPEFNVAIEHAPGAEKLSFKVDGREKSTSLNLHEADRTESFSLRLNQRGHPVAIELAESIDVRISFQKTVRGRTPQGGSFTSTNVVDNATHTFTRKPESAQYVANVNVFDDTTLFVNSPQLDGWQPLFESVANPDDRDFLVEVTPSFAVRGKISGFDEFVDEQEHDINSVQGLLLDSAQRSRNRFGSPSPNPQHFACAREAGFYFNCGLSSGVTLFQYHNRILVAQLPWQYRDAVLAGDNPGPWTIDWNEPKETMVEAIDVSGNPIRLNDAHLLLSPKLVGSNGSYGFSNVKAGPEGRLRFHFVGPSWPVQLELNPESNLYQSRKVPIVPGRTNRYVLRQIEPDV